MNYTPEFLLNFLNTSPSPFHAVENSARLLEESGFTALDFSKEWQLEKGGSYYTTLYGTTLFAFKIGSALNDDHTFRLASAHTDYPCFRVKPHPEMCEKGYLKLNVSPYGGMIRPSWMDRPLSLAGKVALKSKDIFHPEMKLVDFDRPLLTIPNLAIHMNPEINKGVELNLQTDLSPVLGLLTDELSKDNFFLNLLAKELSVTPEDILDFDFYIYNWEKGCCLGMNEEFISSPRLDNLTSVVGCLTGLLNSENKNTINVIFLYDNEEIGSKTKQGADSVVANVLLEKIYAALGYPPLKVYETLFKSFMVSADVAHGLHPNFAGKCDPTHQPKLGQGVVLKINHSQKYATDVKALAIMRQLCDTWHIPYQDFVNRSDMPGGGTLGSIASSWLPALTVDLGLPLLAMHSAREMMGTADQDALNRLICAVFSA